MITLGSKLSVWDSLEETGAPSAKLKAKRSRGPPRPSAGRALEEERERDLPTSSWIPGTGYARLRTSTVCFVWQWQFWFSLGFGFLCNVLRSSHSSHPVSRKYRSTALDFWLCFHARSYHLPTKSGDHASLLDRCDRDFKRAVATWEDVLRISLGTREFAALAVNLWRKWQMRKRCSKSECVALQIPVVNVMCVELGVAAPISSAASSRKYKRRFQCGFWWKTKVREPHFADMVSRRGGPRFFPNGRKVCWNCARQDVLVENRGFVFMPEWESRARARADTSAFASPLVDMWNWTSLSVERITARARDLCCLRALGNPWRKFCVAATLLVLNSRVWESRVPEIRAGNDLASSFFDGNERPRANPTRRVCGHPIFPNLWVRLQCSHSVSLVISQTSRVLEFDLRRFSSNATHRDVSYAS